jgi:hypothetical protein
MKQPRPIRDVALVIALKLVLLTALFLLFFGPASQPESGSAAVADHLLNTSSGNMP